MIVCGDFGIWHDTKEERYWLDWLQEKPFTIVFCDGNHENHDRLNSGEFPEVTFNGARAHKIRENIFHIIRGEIMDYAGYTFAFFGGARSHDIRDGILDPADFESWDAFKKEYYRWEAVGKQFRVNRMSWWADEMPTYKDYFNFEARLREYDNEVDFVITHCAPQRVAAAMGFYDGDELTKYFDEMCENFAFRNWFFGHYHRNVMIDCFRCIYEDIIELQLDEEDEDGQVKSN